MLEVGDEFYPFREKIIVDRETGGISSPTLQLGGYGEVTVELLKMEPRGMEYNLDEPQWVVSENGVSLLRGSAYVFSVSVGDDPSRPLDEPLVCVAVVGGQVFISGGDRTGFFEEWEPVDSGQRGEMIVSAEEELLRPVRVKLDHARE